MSTDTIHFSALGRTSRGKEEAKRMRKDGQVPAVVYGEGKEGVAIQINNHDFEMLLAHHASESLLIDLKIDDGKAIRVLLKDVQNHPVTGRILHVDFHEISMSQPIRVSIGLNFTGIPVGVTNSGGSVETHVRTLQVECLPDDLVETFDVEIGHLDLKEHMLVSDIQVDTEKYRVISAPEISVVSVAAPRVSGKTVGGAAEDESDEADAAEGDAAAGDAG